MIKSSACNEIRLPLGADGFGCEHLGVAFLSFLTHRQKHAKIHNFGRKQKQKEHLKLVKFFRRPCKTTPRDHTNTQSRKQKKYRQQHHHHHAKENNGGSEMEVFTNTSEEREREANIRNVNKRERE